MKEQRRFVIPENIGKLLSLEKKLFFRTKEKNII